MDDDNAAELNSLLEELSSMSGLDDADFFSDEDDAPAPPPRESLVFDDEFGDDFDGNFEDGLDGEFGDFDDLNGDFDDLDGEFDDLDGEFDDFPAVDDLPELDPEMEDAAFEADEPAAEPEFKEDVAVGNRQSAAASQRQSAAASQRQSAAASQRQSAAARASAQRRSAAASRRSAAASQRQSGATSQRQSAAASQRQSGAPSQRQSAAASQRQSAAASRRSAAAASRRSAAVSQRQSAAGGPARSSAAASARSSRASGASARSSRSSAASSRSSAASSRSSRSSGASARSSRSSGASARSSRSSGASARSSRSSAARSSRASGARADKSAPNATNAQSSEGSKIFFSGVVALKDENASREFLQLVSGIVHKVVHIFQVAKSDASAPDTLSDEINRIPTYFVFFDDAVATDLQAELAETKARITDVIGDNAPRASVRASMAARRSDRESLVLDVPYDETPDVPSPVGGAANLTQALTGATAGKWRKEERQQIAGWFQTLLTETVVLMRLTEQTQLQAFVKAVQLIVDTVDHIISNDKNLALQYRQHLDVYMDRVFPLVENKVEVTTNEDAKLTLTELLDIMKEEGDAFKTYVDYDMFPADSGADAKPLDDEEERQARADPFRGIVLELIDFLELSCQPVTEFNYEYIDVDAFTTVVTTMKDAAKEGRASDFMESARRTTALIKDYDERGLDTSSLRRTTMSFIRESKRLMSDPQPADPSMDAEDELDALMGELESELGELVQEEEAIQHGHLVEKNVEGQLPETIARMSMLANDADLDWDEASMRVSRASSRASTIRDSSRSSRSSRSSAASFQ